jgi:hypothetical protein
MGGGMMDYIDFMLDLQDRRSIDEDLDAISMVEVMAMVTAATEIAMSKIAESHDSFVEF